MPASANAMTHGTSRAPARRVGLGQVLRVGGDAVADELGVDPRAAPGCVPELLEHEHGAGLAHDEAVAIGVERPARVLWVVVATRERAHAREKPAIPTRVIGASLPPANMTSARPRRIASSPSPIAIVEAAQAVHWEESGPFVPSSIETRAGAHVRE